MVAPEAPAAPRAISAAGQGVLLAKGGRSELVHLGLPLVRRPRRPGARPDLGWDRWPRPFRRAARSSARARNRFLPEPFRVAAGTRLLGRDRSRVQRRSVICSSGAESIQWHLVVLKRVLRRLVRLQRIEARVVQY